MKQDYIVINNAIPADLCRFISTEFRMFETMFNIMRPNFQNDGINNAFAEYCLPFMEALSLYLQPTVENLLDKKLYPSYSYGRIYKTGSELPKHVDRRSSEYTLSCCLEKDPVDWALCFENYNKEVFNVDLNEGDVVLYQGRKYLHWRDGPFKGKEQVQAFIQYVDANGDSADLKWDGKPAMSLPYDYVPEWHKEEIKKSYNNYERYI